MEMTKADKHSPEMQKWIQQQRDNAVALSNAAQRNAEAALAGERKLQAEIAAKPISKKAFINRMTKHLAKKGLALKEAPLDGYCCEYHPFFICNARGAVVQKCLEFSTLVIWGTDAGLLRFGESVATEHG